MTGRGCSTRHPACRRRVSVRHCTTNSPERSAINDPRRGRSIPRAILLFYLPPKRLIIYASPALVFTAVITASSLEAAAPIKSDYPVVSGISFRGFRFSLSLGRSGRLSVLLLSFPVSRSPRHLVPCLRNDRHSEPRPFSAR